MDTTTVTAPRESVFSTATAPRASVFRLFRALTTDTRTLLRQELQLAKTEISEKISRMGRNAAALAVGGFVAYAGLIVFLIGLGWLLAWAFSLAGLAPIFAAFLGLAIIGLIATAIGCGLLLKGLKTFSKESLAPERTLHTLQELKGTRAAALASEQAEGAAKPSSGEMQARVELTESRMGETLDELGERLSPQHINAEVKQRIQANPYRAGLYAMLAGLVSGLLLRRKYRHA
jgi:ElaB/YqjD/DUF883 family membrane-anchored ribosome-binding protein